MLKSLDHPNVLKVRECLIEGDHTLIVVEDYCQGGTLADCIGSRTIDVKKSMKEIALGVHYLHQRKIVHSRLSSECISFRQGAIVVGGVSRLWDE